MSKALIEDILDDSEWAQETALPATDNDLLILTEKFLGFEIPPNVFLQAISIAAYDCAAAFRYTDNYLAVLKTKNKRKNLLLIESYRGFENN
ncbi:hypothetical protein A6770_07770 [Nostoc minutum NIES-26]|uniref:Uncharacterized protein n=1 Tax=Nostoc minutum NIES-26 TaxID=1844469 RepID=A0A367S1X9_9NOSO|nr:hypothetical protein [Dendronalium sp. ChiSLP03b]MDZ8208072.1 hypothetical protein [Dendronalium sp. ChiSLP03b]RCJ42765.1 hypothetical protein A6770_07770 [Nostoc minutum NIES-26]